MFRADHFAFTIPPRTTLDMSAGPDHWNDWRLKMADASGGPLSIVVEEAGQNLVDVKLSADATAGQLLAASKNLEPGGSGRVDLSLGLTSAIWPSSCRRRLRSKRVSR